jgi:hypothetical protein
VDYYSFFFVQQPGFFFFFFLNIFFLFFLITILFKKKNQIFFFLDCVREYVRVYCELKKINENESSVAIFFFLWYERKFFFSKQNTKQLKE